MKTKIIYMPWIAAELRKRGFPILEVVVNERKPQFDAYVFEETEEFSSALKNIVLHKD